MEDIYVIFNNGHFELMADMVIKGKEEKKEQFATAMGKIDESGNLKVEDFDIWDNSLLSQSVSWRGISGRAIETRKRWKIF